jgi:hypothetical protein
MDDRDDLLLRYLQQFALPPSPPRQDEFKTHAVANQPTYSPPGEAVGQPQSPQFQAWHWSVCGELGPSFTQSRRFIRVKV